VIGQCEKPYMEMILVIEGHLPSIHGFIMSTCWIWCLISSVARSCYLISLMSTSHTTKRNQRALVGPRRRSAGAYRVRGDGEMMN
jgi:hypothetical protein